jgi:hypothetical protein
MQMMMIDFKIFEYEDLKAVYIFVFAIVAHFSILTSCDHGDGLRQV